MAFGERISERLRSCRYISLCMSRQARQARRREVVSSDAKVNYYVIVMKSASTRAVCT
jgi:hypothetical protein